VRTRKQLIDSSVKVDDFSLRKVRLGRNKFLKLSGGALFALATGALLPKAAYAAADGNDAVAAAPYPCYGYDECSCCYRESCCVGGCAPITTCRGSQCWWTSAGGATYHCCDWQHGGTNCICVTASVG
jgi:hypothetical protein